MSLSALLSLLLLFAGVSAPAPHVVHVAADGWAEVRAELPSRIGADEAYWTWSEDCAPQRRSHDSAVRGCVTSDEIELELRAGTRQPRAADVRWGTAAMLRELPDGLLPVVRTDAAGKARLRVPRGERVYARVAGPALASRWTALRAPRTTIAAGAAMPFTTRVVDGGGVDARRAFVEVRTVDLAQPEDFAFRGAGDGVVVIPPIPADAWLKLLAWSESGAPTVVRGTPRQIVLGDGFSMRGLAADEKDAAVAAAEVTARFVVRGERRTLVKHRRTDGQGRFTMAGLPAGEVELTLRKAPFANESQVVSVEPDVDLGTVILRYARTVSLRVTDARQQPVASATVAAGEVRATTDAAGLARLERVPAETFVLRIASRGFHDEEVEVDADAPSPFAVVLRDSARIRARLVRADDGTPAGAGTVSVDFDGRQSVVSLAGDGTLDIDDLGGGTVTLEIRAASLAPFRMPPRHIEDGELVDLGTIVLGRGLSVTGRVIDDASAPVAGAVVRMLRPSGFGPTLSYLQRDWTEAHSSADGTFRIEGLASGIYSLWIEAVSRAPVVRAGLEVSPDLPNGELNSGEIRIREGRTVVVDCQPVARCGTHVTLSIAGADWLPMTVPWSGGIATLGPVAPGPATLRIADRRGVVHERAVQVAEDEPKTLVRVRLAGVEVTGHVMRGGRGVEGGQVVLSPSDGEPTRFIQIAQRGSAGTIGNEILGAVPRQLSASVSEHGVFRLSDVAPGAYSVTWSADGAQSAPQRVSISENAAPLRIELSGGAVAGVVLTHDGAPQPHALVTAEQATRRTNAVAGVGGTFSIVGLEAGPVVLRASSGPRAKATASVSEGRMERVDLTLEEAREDAFEVLVSAPSGPLASAYVFLDDGGAMRAATTGADGRASFRITPGDRTVAIAVYSAAFGWTFRRATTGAPAAVHVSPSTAGMLFNGDGSGPVAVQAPDGFPLHAALSILGIATITRPGTQLRIDRLPGGTYTVQAAGIQQLVTLSADVRDVRF